MADGADPHRATGAPPRRGTPLGAGYGRSVDPLTAQGGIVLPRFRFGTRQPITNRFGPLCEEEEEEEEEDVAAAPDPPSRADVVSRRRRRRRRRSGAGSQASSSAAPMMDGGAADPDSPGFIRTGGWGRRIESGYHRVGIPSHRRRSLLSQSQASSSAAPSSDHPGAEGRIRVRQSALYSDRPRHSRPRRPARAEASMVGSSELHSPVMDMPTFEALSLSDPSPSTPETAEMTNVDHAPRSEQEEHICEMNSSEFDMEVIEALSLSDPSLLTPQTETDEESTDDDCALVPTTRQTELFFNRPKGISRSMVLSTPLLGTIPNVKEQRPKLYSDVDPKDVQHMVKEYLDACPCIDLDIAPDSILAVEEARNARAAELGTEPQLPSVIEQSSVAAAHHQQSMVPTESRHEASAEEIIPNGTAWMEEEVMLCFKKLININRHLAKLEDYRLEELQHQCFNVESYDKVYHHYNFTVRMKMPDPADWKVKLYFAEVKEVFRKKYYFCYPLDPNENGQCYACKNQGVEDLRHPAIVDLFETGSPDASCNLWYTDDESDEEATRPRFKSDDSLDLGVLFGS